MFFYSVFLLLSERGRVFRSFLFNRVFHYARYLLCDRIEEIVKSAFDRVSLRVERGAAPIAHLAHTLIDKIEKVFVLGVFVTYIHAVVKADVLPFAVFRYLELLLLNFARLIFLSRSLLPL